MSVAALGGLLLCWFELMFGSLLLRIAHSTLAHASTESPTCHVHKHMYVLQVWHVMTALQVMLQGTHYQLDTTTQ